MGDELAWLVACAIVGLPSAALAKNVYVTQTASGGNTGADCANAHAAAWFNTAANWGSGSTQISAGDTVHLCSTITSALSVQANGTSSATTTILFEAGAKISLPYCPASGCLGLSGRSYIAVDGGTNGIVEATASGTGKNQQLTYGIYGDGSLHDIEVRNLTVRNIYVRTAQSEDNTSAATNSGAIHFKYARSNIKIHHNTIVDAHTGIGVWADYNGTYGNWEIYNNTVSQACWHIDVTGGYTGGFLDGALIHDNTLFDTDHWWAPSNNFHIDPIFVRSPNSSNSPSGGAYGNVYIYNNYIYGSIGHTTGYIFLSQYSNGPTYVFNNVFNPTSTSPEVPCAMGAIQIPWNGTDKYYVYNNTIDGRTACGNAAGERSTNSFVGTYLEWKNNIGLNIKGHYIASGTCVSDYNNWFHIEDAFGQAFNLSGTWYTWAAWQSAGKDANSTSADPLVNADYTLQPGSPAIRLGQNLTSICQGQPVPGLGALCRDKNGILRPQTDDWDAGAFQHSEVGELTPPSGLTAAVH